MSDKLIALFGGTFDPIHNGHLMPVSALAKEVKLAHISLLPNNIPPHKPQPCASPQQRLDMLKLAIENNPLFSVDTRELSRDTLSYTIETLAQWRTECGALAKLAFIIGQDSLLSLPTWHRWHELLNYCHLLVCRRPGFQQQPMQPELQYWLAQHQTTDIQALHKQSHGLVYLADTPLENISATEIRQCIANQQTCHHLLPDSVWHYIRLNKLYM